MFKKFIENWKGHDYVFGLFTGLLGWAIVLLIWHVSVGHLWDLFRHHWVDILLLTGGMGCFRYCYILYVKRGIPKFKTDWPIFWDRNGLIVGLWVAGMMCLALIDPQLTGRIVDVFN